MSGSLETWSGKWLIAIDTCGTVGGAALGRLYSDEESRRIAVEVVAETELRGKTYSALLVQRIGELLGQAGATLADVAALVVVNGPGSFTGVRVGVSAAKGLAEGAGLPVIALSRLELLARSTERPSACAALDAGRGEFYFGNWLGRPQQVEALYSAGEVLAAVRESGLPLAVCEADVAARLAVAGPLMVTAPTATLALMLAAERLVDGAFTDAATLDGNYLRRPYAEGLVEDIGAHTASPA